MARRPTLTHEALVALGADKLAHLVLSAAGDPAFKRLVKAALAGARGPEAVAAVVDRRLRALERARGAIDWRRSKVFAADLGSTLVAITGELGVVDPGMAVERLLRFLGGAEQVLARTRDGSGQVLGIYQQAAASLPALAGRLTEEDLLSLVDRLVPLVLADASCLIEGLIRNVLVLLPAPAIDRLEAGLAAAAAGAAASVSARHDWERRQRRDRVLRCRQAIADQRGDVDAFVALEGGRPGEDQDTLGVAERLLAAGRAAEALDWVRRPPWPALRDRIWPDAADAKPPLYLPDRHRIRVEVHVLDALGEHEAAQALRWRAYEATLDEPILREYVARLPDFEDVEELERAFAHALRHARPNTALALFLSWPRLDLAARLVLDRQGTWQGQLYHELAPAAEALETRHPYAAAVLHRALIDHILSSARTPAYGHAARYLGRLDQLPEPSPAPPGWTDHDAYRAGLAQAHGRKAAFWGLVRA